MKEITFKQFAVACVYKQCKINAIKLYRDLNQASGKTPSLMQAKYFIEKEIPNEAKAEEIINNYKQQQKDKCIATDIASLQW